MAVNWNLLQNVDVGGAFQKGMEQGRERQAENALAAYVQNPQDANAFSVLAQRAPKLAYQVRGDQQDADLKRAKFQQAGRAAQMKEAEIAAQFIDKVAPDGSNYPQVLQAARMAGVDVSTAPATFDPQWVGSQRIIMKAFTKDPDGLTSEAKNLAQLGYKPGTPEFQVELAKALNAKYAQPYIGQDGSTKVRTPNLVPAGQAPQAGISANAQQAAPILRQAMQAKTITREDVARVSGSFGAQGQAAVQDWLKRNGIRVVVRTGTAPDGRRVAEYEDGTVDYAD